MTADLIYTFQSLGLANGYDDVEAEFAPFKEFKSTWKRSGHSVRFQISDYLRGADRRARRLCQLLHGCLTGRGPGHLLRQSHHLDGSKDFVNRNNRFI